MRFKSLLAVAVAVMVLVGCGPKNTSKIKIGLSLDTLKEERWQHDRDFFTAKAKALGAQVLVQAANNDAALQNSQAEDLLTEGVNVLVVVPHDAKSAATIVEAAHKAGVPVLSYDRLIRDSDVDLYVSFDNFKVGQLQAGYLLKEKPKGNYLLVEGAPTDNNAKMLREGQMKILKPAIDRGDIKVVGQQWVPEWSASTALRIMEDALTANNNKIDAVVASNDGTAGGAIQALAAQHMAGKVPVSGQDADLAAVRRLIDGTQTMTVYKPLKLIASQAANLAVQLAKGDKPAYNAQYDNGKKKVDTILLQPTLLTKSNVDVVIKDGFYTQAQLASQ